MELDIAVQGFLETLNSESARVNYGAALRQFFNVVGLENVEDIDEDAVHMYLGFLESKAQRTQASRLASIRRFIDYCMVHGWLETHPALGQSLVNGPNYKNSKNISLKDFKKLLSAIDINDLYGVRNYLLIALAFYCGDINKVLRLGWNASLPQETLGIRLKYESMLRECRPELTLDYGYLFFGTDNVNPLPTRWARKILENCSEHAGFENTHFSFMGLRRLRAKIIWKKTKSVKAVQKFCSHKSSSTTRNFLKHLS